MIESQVRYAILKAIFVNTLIFIIRSTYHQAVGENLHLLGARSSIRIQANTAVSLYTRI